MEPDALPLASVDSPVDSVWQKPTDETQTLTLRAALGGKFETLRFTVSPGSM
jgi:hypothetical protein